jgi:AcrR family transcriptional regulator
MLDQALDAAEEVILRDGIACFTLEAVARQAKLSKGGLLHHYPSKDALIAALVHRKVGAWRRDYEAAIAAQPPGPGRVPRAFLGLCLSSTKTWNETLRRSSQVLMAALVHDPSQVEPLREAYRDTRARLADDGLPPGVGEAVLLAMDGLWFDWIFGIAELTPEKVGNIRDALERWIDSAPTEQTTTKPRRPARTRK